MPKKVDHQQRRTLIADALMRVAAEHGLEAVSLRHVAAAAGVTAGMVQHYFGTKDEMMTFALAVVREHIQARMTAAVDRLGGSPAPRALLRSMFVEMLPLDDASRADSRVALAFLAYTAVRPQAATALRQDAAGLLAFLAELIRSAQAAGEAHPTLDPVHAATGLLALVEGLGVYLLGDHYAADTALGALDAHLDVIFPPQA